MKSFVMMCATLLTAAMAQAQFVSFPTDCTADSSEACVDGSITDANNMDVERFQRPDRPPRPGEGRPGHAPGDHHRPPPMPPGGGFEPPHHRPPRPGYPDRPTYPTYPSHPHYPDRPTYPDYPTYPDRPTYPGYPTYPSQPTYPDYPTYPDQPPYDSGYLPNGSYIRSCQGCDVQGPMLTCECRSSRGQWFWSSIDTRACRSIANIEGTLRCE